MSSLDPTIFERSKEGLVLSQRFKHMCEMLYGTFKVSLQALSENALLQFLPTPLAFLPLLFYLLVILFLLFLTLNQLCNNESQKYEDFDLIDMINPKKKDTWNRIVCIAVILFLVFNFELCLRVLLHNKEKGSSFMQYYKVVLSYIFFCFIWLLIRK